MHAMKVGLFRCRADSRALRLVVELLAASIPLSQLIGYYPSILDLASKSTPSCRQLPMLPTPVFAYIFDGMAVVFLVILERLEKLGVSVARLSRILPKRRHRHSQLVRGRRLTRMVFVLNELKNYAEDQKPQSILSKPANRSR